MPAGAPDELDWRYAGWRVALGAGLASMAGFGAILIYSFGVMMKPVTAEFGWSRQTISTAFACASFTLGLASPGLGWMLDRYGPRRVILPCVIVFGLAFSSLSLLTNSLVQLFGTFILIGMVGNATAQMGFARAVSSWFEEHRGKGLALMIAGGTVGSVFVPLITQRLLALYGWRSTYAILGAAPLLIAAPLVVLFVREKTHHRAVTASVLPSGARLGEALRSRAFWILALTLFLTAMSTTGIVTHLAALLTDRGVSPRGAALGVSVVAGTGILGRLVTGWFLDRNFGPRVNMVMLFTTAAGLLLLSGTRSTAGGLVASALIGFSAGGESDVTPYLLSRYFGLRRFATLYGLTWTAFAIAAAMGSILLGRAFDSTGSYGTMLIRMATLVLIAGLSMLAMPPYPDKVELREDCQMAPPGLEPEVPFGV